MFLPKVDAPYYFFSQINFRNSQMSKNKFLIVKGKAGMGNRMLSALDGILYSHLTNRKLIVDWSDYTYSNDNSNVFPHFFTIPQNSYFNEIFDDNNIKSICPAIWENNLDKSVNQMIDTYEIGKNRQRDCLSKYTIDIRNLDYTEDILVRCSFTGNIHGFRQNLFYKDEFSNLMNLKDEDILKKLIRENLDLNEDIKKRINLFKEKYFTEHVIGVHVRYTDIKTDLDKYPKIIKSILDKKNQAKKFIIFLATDNKLVESYFWDKYGKNNVILTEKWYPQDYKYLHQNQECPDRLENGIQALVDMYLLAACDYLIYDGNSTFGFVAKLISDIPDSKVIDISRYSIRRKLKRLIIWFQRLSHLKIVY